MIKKETKHLHGYCKCVECKKSLDWSVYKDSARKNMELLKKIQKLTRGK